jgi:hypothetical protein
VYLRLGRARPHRAPGVQISQELRGDGVEHLAGNGETERSDVEQQLARNLQLI